MVVASMDNQTKNEIPVIDISSNRQHASKLIVNACEKYGFFMVVNHGVPESVISNMEAIGSEFFFLPGSDKQRAGPPNPLGYGCKSIGSKGDIGEIEYLLLQANSTYINLRAKTIYRKDPTNFSCVVNNYVEAMKKLACKILELLSEGLNLADKKNFSRLIEDSKSDSLLRLNHYPPAGPAQYSNSKNENEYRVGFGEHTDPQILTLLRSTVGGLQIMNSDNGRWIPVKPDPMAFCVHVGDVLQAMTNGRLLSVRHRAIVNSCSARTSLVYFAAPAPHALIAPVKEMIASENSCRYKPFTWSAYKKAMYSLRLGQNRLDYFRSSGEEHAEDDLYRMRI